MTFTVTPPNMIISRCQAGFARNSHGSGSFDICSVSIDSSIIPEIFTYPPRGNQPIPYSVPPTFFFTKENQGSKKDRIFQLVF